MGLLGVGVVFQLGICVVVGVRLIALWRRTRLIPELAFGITFLSLGALGYPLSIAARTGLVGGAALSLALAAQDVACFSLFVGTWRVFRPFETRLRGVAVLLGIGFGLSLLAPLFSAAGAAALDGGLWYYVGFAGRFGAFAWAAFESLRYYALLRRRLALALADPVVVDRFRLWSICTGSITLAFVVFLLGRLLTDNVGEAAWVLLTTSAIGLLSGVSMWLVFFPPERYLARVSRAAAAIQ